MPGGFSVGNVFQLWHVHSDNVYRPYLLGLPALLLTVLYSLWRKRAQQFPILEDERTLPVHPCTLLDVLDIYDLHQELDFLIGPVALGRLCTCARATYDRLQRMVVTLKRQQDKKREHVFYISGRNSGARPNGSSGRWWGKLLRLECWKPNQVWKDDSGVPTVRYAAAAAVLGNKILVMGGYHARDSDVTEVYDARSQCWSRPKELQLSRPRSECAAAVRDGCVYLIGGTSRGEELCLSERFDGKGWEKVSPLPVARAGCGVAVTGGQLYAVGGFHRGEALPFFERYDSNGWTQLPPLAPARWSCAAVGLRGVVYVCGGYNGGVPLNSLERFHPIVGHWEKITTLPTPRKQLAAVAAADTLYVIGGFDGRKTSSSIDAYGLSSKTWHTVKMGGESEWGCAVRLLM